MKRAGWLAVAVCVALASPAFGRVVKGMNAPEQISVGGRELTLNGTAVQRKFVFDIYVIGLYLERPTRNAKAAVYSDQMKRLQLQMKRGARADQITGAFREGFKRGNGGNIAGLEERLEKVLAAIPDMKEGDQLYITAVPGKGTVLELASGKQMTIPGKDFAAGMFNIWLGADPGTAHLKEQLLEGPKPAEED